MDKKPVRAKRFNASHVVEAELEHLDWATKQPAQPDVGRRLLAASRVGGQKQVRADGPAGGEGRKNSAAARSSREVTVAAPRARRRLRVTAAAMIAVVAAVAARAEQAPAARHHYGRV